MSDLIDRQQAIDVLEEQLDYLFMLNKKDNPTAESKWYGVNWARNMIAELPTIELVRCGECEYADEYNHCKYSAWWNGNADFCSHGIPRKESR